MIWEFKMTYKRQVRQAAERLRTARKVAPRSCTVSDSVGGPGRPNVRPLRLEGLLWADIWDELVKINPKACA